MFFNQCNVCNERWEAGTASTCKCLPLPDYKFTYDGDYSKFIVNTGNLKIAEWKPNYTMHFHKDGKTIGTIDWNGPEMKFSGYLDESAKVFFEYLAESFKGRLEQERTSRQPWVGLTDEQIAKEVEAELTHYWNGEYIDTTGARDQLTDFTRAIEAKIKEKNT